MPGGILEFDKDDEESLNFVTATSNIRSHIFNIKSQSRFSVKEIAGNIIPAIATTNAIVAGMIVMLAIRLIRGDTELNNTFVVYGGDRANLLLNDPLAPPNKSCVVCTSSFFKLVVDPSKTVSDFLKALEGFGMDGELTIQKGEMLIYDVEFDDNLGKSFESLGLDRGELTVTNDSDDDNKNYCCIFFVTKGQGLKIVGERKFTPRPVPKLPVEEVEPSKKRSGEELDAGNKKVKIETVLIDENAPIELD